MLSEEKSEKEMDFLLLPYISIDDRSTIRFFVEEFFLPEDDYARIEVIDTESNGFGQNDLLKFYPSGSMYYLDMVTDSAQKVMNSWQIKENIEIVTDLREIDVLDTIPSAEYGILSSLAKGIERNYRDFPINLSMKRDSTGLVFEMWGYESEQLEYTPPPPPVPDSVPVYDLISSFREEKTVEADTTLYDIFFIYRSEVDTVFLEGVRP
jgi:hypothetical protein